MTPGENITKSGDSEEMVSLPGVGAMTPGDRSMSHRFDPARYAYGHSDEETLNHAAIKWGTI